MPVDNSTQEVIVSRSGTGWTVDVTNCNLSTDLLLKDFKVYFDGIVQSTTNFTKTSVTVITYSGSSIGSTTVKIRRSTPVTRIQEVQYADKLSSSLWENEFNRTHRILAEVQKFGSDDVSSFAVSDAVYDSTLWNGDTLTAPSKNVVRDLVESRFPFDTVRHISLISDLTALAKPDTGTKVVYLVRGYYTVGDGGGGLFYWDEADTTTSADTGIVFLVGGVSANGRWKRMIFGEFVNVAWYGFRSGIGTGFATANSTAIQNAVNSDYNVYIPAGNYTINVGIRVSAGYFNSIGKSIYHGWGKKIVGAGRSRCRIYCWTGNTPIFDFSGSSHFTLSDIELVNANTVLQGTTEGGSNASALGIAVVRDALTTFNHYINIRNVVVALDYQNNSTQLGGVGTIAYFGLGCEHAYIQNCTFGGNVSVVLTRVYTPSYFVTDLGFAAWNIRDYLPNHSGTVTSSCLIGRMVDCVLTNNDFRRPVMVLDRIGAWTFDNHYMSNRAGGTAGTYQYLINNWDATNIRMQGMAEVAGIDGANIRRRTGFMEVRTEINNWDVDYYMAPGITMPASFTANVPYIFLSYNGVNQNGIKSCKFKIHSSGGLTDYTGYPVTSNQNLANSFRTPAQNCEFWMETENSNADIVGDFIRIRGIRSYEMRTTAGGYGTRHWEDFGIWAYGRVSNAGVRDANTTSPRCPTTSLTTTTYRVNFSDGLTFIYMNASLTVEGATTNLAPIVTTYQPTYFEYQVRDTAGTAVTTGFTNVNFIITQVSFNNVMA